MMSMPQTGFVGDRAGAGGGRWTAGRTPEPATDPDFVQPQGTWLPTQRGLFSRCWHWPTNLPAAVFTK
jgi:hypothetical protein